MDTTIKIKPKADHPWRKTISVNTVKKQKVMKEEIKKRGIK
jgi:hypothetical protein